jgi:hypothetical protein
MLFDKYKTQTKVIKVKALDNQEVTIRELTVNESNEFYKKIVGEPKEDGSMQFNYKEIFSIKVEKVATAMVNPRMTAEELEELSEGATEAINEIAEAIENFNAEGKKKN